MQSCENAFIASRREFLGDPVLRAPWERNSFVLSKRQFVIGSSALVSARYIGTRSARTDVVPLPLPIPDLIEAEKIGHAVTLKLTIGRHAFLIGKPASTYGYSAPVLGPVIRVRRGDEVEITVENRLDCVTTTHWHGVLVAGKFDGGPHQVIKPGKTWRPVLKIDQPASTAWYHPHPHHDTARQVYMGLSGMLIIDDDLSLRLDLPRTYGVGDLPIILQDRSFESSGSLEYNPTQMEIVNGTRGDTVIANGAIAPVAKVPRGLVRLRLLNGANARNFDLRFSDHRTFHIIASDGGYLPEPVAVSQLTMSPGERFEVLVDFTDGRAATLQTSNELTSCAKACTTVLPCDPRPPDARASRSRMPGQVYPLLLVEHPALTAMPILTAL
jgi:blue copper oxidase